MNSRFVFIYGLLAILLISLGWVAFRYLGPTELPINNVKISGDLPHVTRAQLEQVIIPFVQADFFTINVNELRQNLLQFPWIKTAVVSRVWPGTLSIYLAEYKPLARWNKLGLMSQQGDVFFPDPKTLPPDLPQLAGPEQQAKSVFKQYQICKQLLRTLQLQVTRLQLTDRGAWTLSLDNGMQLLLGTRDPIDHLNRFVSVYNGVFGSAKLQAQQVDLRYPNGMAVKWRKAPG